MKLKLTISSGSASTCNCGYMGHHTKDAHTHALSSLRSNMGPPPARNTRMESILSSSTLRGDDPTEEHASDARSLPAAEHNLPSASTSTRKKRKRGVTNPVIDSIELGGEEVQLDHTATKRCANERHSVNINEEQDAATEVESHESNHPVTDLDAPPQMEFDSDEIRVAIRAPQRAKTKASKATSVQAMRPGPVILATTAASLPSTPDSPSGDSLGTLSQQFGMRKGESKSKSASTQPAVEEEQHAAEDPTPTEEPDGKPRRSERKTKPSNKKQRGW